MKKVLLFLALVLFTSSTAYAKSGIYAAPKLYFGNQSVHYNYTTDVNPQGATLGMGLTAGFDMHPSSNAPIRFEGEYTMFTKVFAQYSNNAYLSQVDVNTLFVNFYYDFYGKNNNPIVPYVGGGLGMYFANVTVLTSSQSTSDMAFNLTVGLTYNMAEKMALDFGYRFVALSDMTYFSYQPSTGKQHLVNASARIYF